MSKTELDLDIFTVILSHIHSSSTLYALIRAWPLPHSPYRALAIKRRLELPILLTAGSPRYTSQLVNLILNIPSDLASLVKEVDSAGGPSAKTFVDHWASETAPSLVSLGPEVELPFDIEYDSDEDEDRRNYTARVLAGKKIVQILPLILIRLKNLKKMGWRRCPAPSLEVLRVLEGIEGFREMDVACASGAWIGRNMDEEDEYWDIKLLFTTIGPRLTHLTLHHVTEPTYKDISANFHLLKSLASFNLDINCGDWDWDGMGSPQIGASANYVWEPLTKEWPENLKEVTLRTTDLALSARTGGPLRMLEGSNISKLVLNISPCFGWISIRCNRSFQSLSGSFFPSLSHLVINNVISEWDLSTCTWTNQLPQHHSPLDPLTEASYVVNIHHFLSSLTKLKKLWVSGSTLAVLESPDDPDSWAGRETRLLPIGKETWETEEWAVMRGVLKGQQSLRIGLGPVNDGNAEEIFGACDRDGLTQIGFDYDWNAYRRNAPFSPKVLEELSKFRKVQDVHILFPRPRGPKVIRKEGYDHRFREDNLRMVKSIFSACTSAVRVGVGRNYVWERATPLAAGSEGVQVQLMDLTEAKDMLEGFYDYGWEIRGPMGDGTMWAEGEDVKVNEESGDGKWLVPVLRSATEGAQTKPDYGS